MSRHVSDFDELYDMILLAKRLFAQDVLIVRVLDRALLRIGGLESTIEKLQEEKKNLEFQLKTKGGT